MLHLTLACLTQTVRISTTIIMILSVRHTVNQNTKTSVEEQKKCCIQGCVTDLYPNKCDTISRLQEMGQLWSDYPHNPAVRSEISNKYYTEMVALVGSPQGIFLTILDWELHNRFTKDNIQVRDNINGNLTSIFP